MCINGMFVALELKKSDNEAVDALQDHELNKINNVAHGLGIKVSPENWPEVFTVLRKLSEDSPIR